MVGEVAIFRQYSAQEPEVGSRECVVLRKATVRSRAFKQEKCLQDIVMENLCLAFIERLCIGFYVKLI